MAIVQYHDKDIWKATESLVLNNEAPVVMRVNKPQAVTQVELDSSVDPNSELAELLKRGVVAADGLVQEEDERISGSTKRYRRKLKKRIEVPCTRKVKVPVMTKKVVESIEKRRIKTTELQFVEDWKEVEEKYTEIEEVECVQDKQIWVKMVIPEKFMKKVEVEKTRMVKVPVQVSKEVEVWKEVEVPKQIEVDEEVMEEKEIMVMRKVEFVGYQEIAVEPLFSKLPTKINNCTDQGDVGHRMKRIKGQKEYDLEDDRLDDLDTDSDTDSDTTEVVQGATEIAAGDCRVKRPAMKGAAAAKRQAVRQARGF